MSVQQHPHDYRRSNEPSVSSWMFTVVIRNPTPTHSLRLVCHPSSRNDSPLWLNVTVYLSPCCSDGS
jgi:hypothetical protein